MSNARKIVLPFFALSTLLAGTSAVQAQQPVHGYQNAPWNSGYSNNAPWNGSWMPWNSGYNNGYGNNMPWNSSWVPWNNGYGNNGYGNNMPWNGSWMPGNNSYGNNMPWNGSWMPWNSNGGNNWGGIAGPMDTMMDGMAGGDMAMDFNFKLSGKAKGNGDGDGKSNAAGQSNMTGNANNYPLASVSQVPVKPTTKQDNDSDKDGVSTDFDLCPNSAPNTQVDAFGCHADMNLVLRGVNFITDSDQLTDTSSAILDKVATTLITNPNIKVEVSGHTDSDGDAIYNKDLSQRRAHRVMQYLLTKGVSTDNMQSNGYGEEQPLATNETASGRAENRRVQLTRLGQ